MLSSKLKRLLHWAGSGLGVLGVVFVVFKLVEYGDQIDLSGFSYGASLALLGLVVAYGAANLLLAFAWRDLLKHFGVATDARWALRVYGVTQLARYVPGNIFHLAGRQGIGVAVGLPAWPLAKSALWELGIISITGSLFAFLIFPFFVGEGSGLLALAVFFVAVVACMWITFRWFGRWIARAVGRYAVFLALSGLVFLAVLFLVVPTVSIGTSAVAGICGAYVVAWLAGLVTPGAPAGVGIRELVLFAILQSVVSEADLLAAILLGRVVTVGGDVLFYLAAIAVRK